MCLPHTSDRKHCGDLFFDKCHFSIIKQLFSRSDFEKYFISVTVDITQIDCMDDISFRSQFGNLIDISPILEWIYFCNGRYLWITEYEVYILSRLLRRILAGFNCGRRPQVKLLWLRLRLRLQTQRLQLSLAMNIRISNGQRAKMMTDM